VFQLPELTVAFTADNHSQREQQRMIPRAMSTYTGIRLTEPRLKPGRQLTLHLIEQQRRWIEYCEANGRSYAGPNGPAIRAADAAELKRLESRLTS
jgi:hypothetical protein